MSLAALLLSLTLAGAAPAAAPCNPIPGWDRVLADGGTRWIVIGEMHGTAESPAIFADAVCLTAQSRRVVVALEQPASDQAAIDAFIASDGGEQAKAAFLSATMWNMPSKDGRSSRAYFELFEALRRMHAAGAIEGVVAFQADGFTARPTPAEQEQAMAGIVQAAAKPGTTVLALVGNVHAMRGEVPRDPPYTAMAGNLPAAETLTLDIDGEAGEAWACTWRQKIECGIHPMGRDTGHARGAELSDDNGPYSGVLYLGVPTTASPPQPVGPEG